MGTPRTNTLPRVTASRHDSPDRSCPLAGMSDEDLLASLAASNHEAMNELFHRYYRVVLSVALRIVRDAGESEDVMQEVFLELFRKCHLFDPARGRAKTWILQYAYSRSLDRRQHLALRRFYDQQLLSSETLFGLEPQCSPTAGDSLTLHERTERIRQGMAGLSDKQRKILELAYFEGLEMREIAERTGEPFAQVRNYYYRGLKRLRDAIRSLEAGNRGSGE